MAGASRGHRLVRTPGMVHGTAWMGFWSLESFLEEKKGKAGVKVNSWAHPFPEFCWSGGSWIPTILSSAAPWAVLLHPGGIFPFDVTGWLCLHPKGWDLPWWESGLAPGQTPSSGKWER